MILLEFLGIKDIKKIKKKAENIFEGHNKAFRRFRVGC